MTRLLPLLSLAALTGCAAEGTYPSLAPRAVEKQSFDEPAAAPVTVAPDPALDREVADLSARLQSVAEGFAGAARDADAKAQVARGRPAGSEPWLEAQTALAVLDDWRAQASALSTDVEQLAIARAATLAPPYPALQALAERADAEATGEAAAIARIQAMLAPA